MYSPAHFEENRPEVLHSFIQRHPLGLLIRHTETEGLAADPIPLQLDATCGPHGHLIGHVARANPLWRAADGQEVLAVFQGPQAYVSPNWYATKAEHGKAVPTWNYAVVQARGTLRTFTDPERLREALIALTAQHESSQTQPWALDDAPPDYIEKMMAAIVGIEIEVTQLTGKWKVSQNQPAPNQAGVIAGLQASGSPRDAEMAALVASRSARPLR